MNILGKDFIGKQEDYTLANEGEVRVLYPDNYYYCGLYELSVDNSYCLEIDSDYSFYDKDLWGEPEISLYPKKAYCFIFEHNVINNINVNEIVKKGEAKYLTVNEFVAMMQDLKSKGMITVPTLMCSENEINILVSNLINRDKELNIAKLYSLFKQHNFDDVVLMLDRMILNQV